MDANLENMDDKVPTERIVCGKAVDKCKCGESEERIEKAKAKCSKLELEIQKKNIEYEALETKYKALKFEKLAIEDELRVFKQKFDELNKRSYCEEGNNKVDFGGPDSKMEGVVDLTGEDEEEDVVIQLMMENSSLELEKKRAENEVEVWKEKYRKLQYFVQRMDGNSILEDGEWPLNEKIKLVLEGLDLKVNFPIESRRNGAGETMKIRYSKEKGTNLLHAGSPCYSTGEGIEHLQTTASPYNVTPFTRSSSLERGMRVVPNEECEWDCDRKVRKRLAFEEDRSISKKIAPSTPAGAKPTSLNVIDVYDSDDESDGAPIRAPSINNNENEKVPTDTDHALEKTVGIEEKMTYAISEQRNNENVNAFEDDVPFLSAPKRKRGCNVVASDTESDDDDSIPIVEFKRLHLQEKTPDQGTSDLKSFPVTSSPSRDDAISRKPPRRCLVKVKDRAEKCSSSNLNQTEPHQGIRATDNFQGREEDGLESEGDSLAGFIVHSSSESTGDDSFSESQDKSDASVDFHEILSTLQRNKGNKSKWEYEADMLADFGKDPELCMKAVCALYRQENKKISQGTYYNGRGFNKYDSHRGCTLGNFLTDGDPNNDLKKSLEELQQCDPEAVEICKKLATRYSKQLFENYKNREDPHFLPS